MGVPGTDVVAVVEIAVAVLNGAVPDRGVIQVVLVELRVAALVVSRAVEGVVAEWIGVEIVSLGTRSSQKHDCEDCRSDESAKGHWFDWLWRSLPPMHQPSAFSLGIPSTKRRVLSASLSSFGILKTWQNRRGRLGTSPFADD